MSGNPGGRAKHTEQTLEALELARELAPKAVRRLAEIMDSRDEGAAARACVVILDRALGRPHQQVELQQSDVGSPNTSTATLLAAMTDEELETLDDIYTAAAKRAGEDAGVR